MLISLIEWGKWLSENGLVAPFLFGTLLWAIILYMFFLLGSWKKYYCCKTMIRGYWISTCSSVG